MVKVIDTQALCLGEGIAEGDELVEAHGGCRENGHRATGPKDDGGHPIVHAGLLIIKGGLLMVEGMCPFAECSTRTSERIDHQDLHADVADECGTDNANGLKDRLFGPVDVLDGSVGLGALGDSRGGGLSDSQGP
eukprot:UN5025